MGLWGEQLRKSARLAASLMTGFVAVAAAWGQARVFVTYDGDMLPVVSMEGSAPIVEIDGKRVLVNEGTIRVRPADRYTDGAITVLERGALMGQDYGSTMGGFFFRFNATVEAERDFEDCFVLFVIAPESGSESYVMREISDIDTQRRERIVVTLPINPGFGGGSFGYKLFSKGEEIRRYEPDEPISVMDVKGDLDSYSPSDSASGSGTASRLRGTGIGVPAKAIDPRLLDFPKELVGKLAGGYATAIYSVDEQGRALELIDVQADHAAFLPEVWKTITETKYQPGFYDGKPLVTTVKQTFFFNEFAPFSEAMEMIPYPSIGDRSAGAVYSPLPDYKAKRRVTVKVEATVGLLGDLSDLRIIEGEGTDAAAAALEAVRDWIFLPAVEDGFPLSQTVVIPIEFGANG